MMKIIHGNIFATNCDCIVNTINCVGYMGRGIALEISIRYPKLEKLYQKKCANHEINIGDLWLYDSKNKQPKILNFPTKIDYKNPSKIEYLKAGLESFRKNYHSYNIKSIAFPVLGSANGKIDFNVSLKLMESYLSDLNDINIEIYIFDKNDFKYDKLYLKFLKHINMSKNNEKLQRLSEIIRSRNDILSFSDIVTNRISEEQQDGTFKSRSIATKPFLQKIIQELNQPTIDNKTQSTLFEL